MLSGKKSKDPVNIGFLFSLLAKNNHLELKLTDIEIKLNDKDSETINLREKISYLEQEMTQYIEVGKRYQDNCEKLEAKIDALTRSGDEVRDIHRNQLQDLEIRLSNAKKNEDLLREDNRKLQDDFAKVVGCTVYQKLTCGGVLMINHFLGCGIAESERYSWKSD